MNASTATDLVTLRAEAAKAREDSRIATKHADEAAARPWTPENQAAWMRAAKWANECGERAIETRGAVIRAEAEARCICADLGATGNGQRHTLCPAHEPEPAAAGESAIDRARTAARQAENRRAAVSVYGNKDSEVYRRLAREAEAAYGSLCELVHRTA